MYTHSHAVCRWRCQPALPERRVAAPAPPAVPPPPPLRWCCLERMQLALEARRHTLAFLDAEGVLLEEGSERTQEPADLRLPE